MASCTNSSPLCPILFLLSAMANVCFFLRFFIVALSSINIFIFRPIRIVLCCRLDSQRPRFRRDAARQSAYFSSAAPPGTTRPWTRHLTRPTTTPDHTATPMAGNPLPQIAGGRGVLRTPPSEARPQPAPDDDPAAGPEMWPCATRRPQPPAELHWATGRCGFVASWSFASDPSAAWRTSTSAMSMSARHSPCSAATECRSRSPPT